MTGPGIKPRRVPLGGLAARSRHDLDRHASGGMCLARPLVGWGGVSFQLAWVSLGSAKMERKLICSLGMLLARDYRTQGYG